MRAVRPVDRWAAGCVLDVVPPRVEYSLSDLGDEAAEKVVGLVLWIEGNLERIPGARTGVE